MVEIISVSTSADYTVRITRLGEPIYPDDSATIDNISMALDQQDMVATSFSDRGVSTPDHLTLSFSQDVDVYLAMDARMTSLPGWMNDGSWELTEESVSTSYGIDSPRLVFEKPFTQGQHTLGGNNGSSTGARTNYFVIVVPSS